MLSTPFSVDSEDPLRSFVRLSKPHLSINVAISSRWEKRAKTWVEERERERERDLELKRKRKKKGKKRSPQKPHLYLVADIIHYWINFCGHFLDKDSKKEKKKLLLLLLSQLSRRKRKLQIYAGEICEITTFRVWNKGGWHHHCNAPFSFLIIIKKWKIHNRKVSPVDVYFASFFFLVDLVTFFLRFLSYRSSYICYFFLPPPPPNNEETNEGLISLLGKWPRKGLTERENKNRRRFYLHHDRLVVGRPKTKRKGKMTMMIEILSSRKRPP